MNCFGERETRSYLASVIANTAHKNRFYREPGHIKTASQLGLGQWELGRIDHRRLQLG